MTAPLHILDDFLVRLREVTERRWREVEDWSAADYQAAGLIGARWRRGTTWTGGLSDREIDAIERRYDVSFRPDHRRFLRVLHSTVPPMRCGCYEQGERFGVHDVPGFYDWHRDEAAIRRMMQLLREGLHLDRHVAPDGPWPEQWGPRPATVAARRDRVDELWEGAPRLVPIFGHRYVVAGEHSAVLSAVGTDVIRYGATLADYLLSELAGVVGDEAPAPPGAARGDRIPFWDAYLDDGP